MEWKRALVWIAAGVVIVALAMALTILGDEDAKGAKLAVVVTAFYVGFSAGAIVLVRGALYLLPLGRRQAVMVIIATVAGIALAIVLHNVIYAVTGAEEGFFFLLALLVGPVVLVAAFVRVFRPYDPFQHGNAPRL